MLSEEFGAFKGYIFNWPMRSLQAHISDLRRGENSGQISCVEKGRSRFYISPTSEKASLLNGASRHLNTPRFSSACSFSGLVRGIEKHGAQQIIEPLTLSVGQLTVMVKEMRQPSQRPLCHGGYKILRTRPPRNLLYFGFLVMHLLSSSIVAACLLCAQQVIAAPTELGARDLTSFIASERKFALQGVLNNIGPDGANVSGAGAGLVVASPSKIDPDLSVPFIQNDGHVFSSGILTLHRFLYMEQRFSFDFENACRRVYLRKSPSSNKNRAIYSRSSCPADGQ